MSTATAGCYVGLYITLVTSCCGSRSEWAAECGCIINKGVSVVLWYITRLPYKHHTWWRICHRSCCLSQAIRLIRLFRLWFIYYLFSLRVGVGY